MKSIATLTVVVIALGAAAPAMANSHKVKGERPTFEQLDTNGDGSLSKAEMTAQIDARFAKVDTNGDGALTAQELVARAPEDKKERATKRADRMIKRNDANNDGKLTRDEMPRRNIDRMFKKVDADNNGAISKAEFDAVKEKRKGKRHGKNKKDK